MLGVMKVFPGVRKKTQQGLALRGTGTFPSFRVRAVGSELSQDPIHGLVLVDFTAPSGNADDQHVVTRPGDMLPAPLCSLLSLLQGSLCDSLTETLLGRRCLHVPCSLPRSSCTLQPPPLRLQNFPAARRARHEQTCAGEMVWQEGTADFNYFIYK